MIDYSQCYKDLANSPLKPWCEWLPEKVAQGLNPERWGDLPQWQAALKALPEITPNSLDLNAQAVRIGEASQLSDTQREQLKQQMMAFHPWRKGPFDLFGLYMDTEWRSDWKWERIAPALNTLENRLVLDVGCGSGYHCFRMHGAGARLVVGIDPGPKYVTQFYALKHFTGRLPVHVLPLALEDLAPGPAVFDTVFSMGVLYHRRSPIDHLYQLKQYLRPKGQLVLETLVIDGGLHEALMPAGRYAKMRNVWFIPTVDTLIAWMQRCGYKQVECVDVTPTTTEEQRPTEWMQYESLAHFLDPDDSSRTIEGYPAPKRATIIATY